MPVKEAPRTVVRPGQGTEQSLPFGTQPDLRVRIPNIPDSLARRIDTSTNRSDQ